MYVYSYPSIHTGSPRVLIDLVSNLDRSLFKPHLLTPEKGDLSYVMKRMGVPVFIKTWVSLSKTNPHLFLYDILKFISFFRQHSINLLHINEIGWRDSFVIAAKILKIPIILHMHNPYPISDIRGNFNFSIAKKVITVSESMKDNYTGFNNIMRKIECIYNGVDLKKFTGETESIRNELPIRGEGPVIGFVGQICRRKGVDLLIGAAKNIVEVYPNALFVIAGADGIGEEGYTEKIKTMADHLGIWDNFVFLGKRNDVPKVVNALDILIVPSRAEPFGKVIIEGMAGGKCVIASNVGGIPEIIKDGKNGLLFPVDDRLALEQAMLKVLDDDALRDRLAKEGYSTAKQNFSIERFVDRTQKLYESLIV